MNFKVRMRLPNLSTITDGQDVLISLGLVTSDVIVGDTESSGLGCEASGIIQRVGPDVKDLRPGDRVLTLASGAFSTVLTTSALLCARIPNDLSFEDAATIPCVYSTVIYSLLEIGQLEADQVNSTKIGISMGAADFKTVLIHSGCGGVGMAWRQSRYAR